MRILVFVSVLAILVCFGVLVAVIAASNRKKQEQDRDSRNRSDKP